jgi:hypothetical protein
VSGSEAIWRKLAPSVESNTWNRAIVARVASDELARRFQRSVLPSTAASTV